MTKRKSAFVLSWVLAAAAAAMGLVFVKLLLRSLAEHDVVMAIVAIAAAGLAIILAGISSGARSASRGYRECVLCGEETLRRWLETPVCEGCLGELARKVRVRREGLKEK